MDGVVIAIALLGVTTLFIVAALRRIEQAVHEVGVRIDNVEAGSIPLKASSNPQVSNDGQSLLHE